MVQYGTSDTRYICFAKPGTSVDAAGWKIMRLSVDNDGNTSKLWASGTTAYKHVASSAEGYSYS